MQQATQAKNLIAWSAIATIVAGIIHLVIIPDHWEHAPAHGLFFLIVGSLQVIWGVAVWRNPSERLYFIGVVMAGWLIVLYVLTRTMPAPFGHGPEEVSSIDIACKLCEALGMVTLAILIYQGTLMQSGRLLAWRAITVIVAISFLSAFVTYGLARAAEPMFPSLTASEHHHDHDGDHIEEEHHGHEEATATP